MTPRSLLITLCAIAGIACAGQAAAQAPTPTTCEWEWVRPSGIRDVQWHGEEVGPGPEPRMLHPQIFADGGTSLAFTWITDLESVGSVVEIRTEPEGPVHTVEGRSYTWPELEAEPRRRFHEVRVCGLTPGQRYGYRVGGNGHWSEWHPVRAAPAPGSSDPFRIAVLGDSRSNAVVWEQVIAAVSVHQPDLMVFTGDMVGDGRLQARWDAWFEAADPELASTVFIAVHGNHERRSLEYRSLFVLPEDEFNFVLNYGNTALIVFDDSVDNSALADDVAPWLDHALESADDARWTMVFNHRPFYSSGEHGSNRHLHATLLETIDRRRPDLVFNGHDHNYERTVPLRNGERADVADGVTYIVSAGAGAVLHPSGGRWFTEVSESIHHYVLLDVAGDVITGRALRLDGSVLDEFTLGGESPSSQPAE